MSYYLECNRNFKKLQNSIHVAYAPSSSKRPAPVERGVVSEQNEAQPKTERRPQIAGLENEVTYTTNKKKEPFSFSAEIYHKIIQNDYSLLNDDRVPGFIKSEFSEIFRDC